MTDRSLTQLFQRGLDHLNQGGFRYWIIVAIERSVSLVNPNWRVYSEIAPRLSSKLFLLRMREYDRPPLPLKTVWVDPSEITSFSKREYPPWEYREIQFGSVLDGDWDIQNGVSIRPGFEGPPPEIYLADEFEDNLLHQAMKNRYRKGYDWKDTEFIQRVLNLVEDRSPVWHECYSKSEIWDRCEEVDELYSNINKNGYKSQWKLIESGQIPQGYLHTFANEITVDIGRSGELLLVSGRHRLSIAKLLNIERIPITFLVRHKNWMQYRDKTTMIDCHPDLLDLNPNR